MTSISNLLKVKIGDKVKIVRDVSMHGLAVGVTMVCIRKDNYSIKVVLEGDDNWTGTYRLYYEDAEYEPVDKIDWDAIKKDWIKNEIEYTSLIRKDIAFEYFKAQISKYV